MSRFQAKPLDWDRELPRPPLPPGPYLVAGVGQAGAAAAAALTALTPRVEVRAWDGLGRDTELAAADRLVKLGIATSRGSEGLELLHREDRPRTIVKSPGLRPDVPLLREAVARGIEVIDEAELGWRLDHRPFVAVTGTNGKSTTTSLVAAVLRGAGRRPIVGGNTRSGPALSAAARFDGDVIVAELSSFQLEACPTLRANAAVFTNLTLDHLYRHGSVAAYGACKRQLFVRDDRPVAVAAIGVDQAFGRRLARDVRRLGGRVVTFGRHPSAERRLLGYRQTAAGCTLQIAGKGAALILETRLLGLHNAENVLAALAISDALGFDVDQSAAALALVDPLPGRLERIETTGGPIVLVDFAHNPDGVRRASEAARSLLLAGGGGVLRVVASTLSIVDAAQAHALGRAARAGSDALILTTQRWRIEDRTDRLPEGLLEGAQSLPGGSITVRFDRAEAIATALAEATPADVVLILDRGERDGLLLDHSDHAAPFDDRVEARRVLDLLPGGSPR